MPRSITYQWLLISKMKQLGKKFDPVFKSELSALMAEATFKATSPSVGSWLNIMLVDGHVAGFSYGYPMHSEAMHYLSLIYVSQVYRGQHLSIGLMANTLERLRAQHVPKVFLNNAAGEQGRHIYNKAAQNVNVYIDDHTTHMDKDASTTPPIFFDLSGPIYLKTHSDEKRSAPTASYTDGGLVGKIKIILSEENLPTYFGKRLPTGVSEMKKWLTVHPYATDDDVTENLKMIAAQRLSKWMFTRAKEVKNFYEILNSYPSNHKLTNGPAVQALTRKIVSWQIRSTHRFK